MSLAKLCAGRNRESNAWDYFIYVESVDKTVCDATTKDQHKREMTQSASTTAGLTEQDVSSLDTNAVALAPGLMKFKHAPGEKMKLDSSLQPLTPSVAGSSTIHNVKNIQNEIERYIAGPPSAN